MVESTSKLRSLVKALTNTSGKNGFDIMLDKDNYKSIYDIVVGIGERWKDMTDINRAALLEALAGKTQTNALAAALNNVDQIKEAYKTAENSAGSATREQEKYEKSVVYHINLFKEAVEELAHDSANSEGLKLIIDFGTTLIKLLDTAIDKFGLLSTVAGTALATMSFKSGNNFIENTASTIGTIAKNTVANINQERQSGNKINLGTIGAAISSSIKDGRVNALASGAQQVINAYSAQFGNNTENLSENLNNVASSIRGVTKEQISLAEQVIASNGSITVQSGAIEMLSKSAKNGSAATTLLSKAMTGLKIIGTQLAFTAAIAGISFLIEKIYEFSTAAEKAREQGQKSYESYIEETDKLNSLNEKLNDINSQIKAIKAHGKLSLTDEKDLERLEKIKDEISAEMAIARASKLTDIQDAYEKKTNANNRDVKEYKSTAAILAASDPDYIDQNGVKANKYAEFNNLSIKDRANKSTVSYKEQLESYAKYRNALVEGQEKVNAELSRLNKELEEDPSNEKLTKDIEDQKNKLINYTNELVKTDESISKIKSDSIAYADTIKAHNEIGLYTSKDVLQEAEDIYSIVKEYDKELTDSGVTVSEKRAKEVENSFAEIERRATSSASVIASLEESINELVGLETSTKFGENIAISQEQMNKYGQAVEYVNGVYRINSSRAKDMMSAQLDASKAQLKHNEALDKARWSKNTKEIDELTEAMKSGQTTIEDGTVLIKDRISELEKENAQIDANISSYSIQTAKLEEMTSAYKNWLNVSSQAVDADNFTNLSKAADAVLEGLKTGKVGDVYKAALEAVVPEADQKTHKQIKAYVDSVKKYFTEDSNGLQKFVNDAMKQTAESGSKLIVQTTDGYVLGEGVKLDDFVKKLNITKDVARSLFDELQHAYGWEFDWGDESPEDISVRLIKLKDSIEDVKNQYDEELQSLNSVMTNLVDLKLNYTSQGLEAPANIDYMIDVVTRLQTETDPEKIQIWINTLKNSGLVAYENIDKLSAMANALKKSSDEYESFNSKINEDVSKKYEVNKEKIEDLTSLLDKLSEERDGVTALKEDEVAKAIELFNKYGINIDTSDAETAISQLSQAITLLTGADNIIDIKAYTAQADEAISKIKQELESLDKQMQEENDRWSKLKLERANEGEALTSEDYLAHFNKMHELRQQESGKKTELKTKENEKRIIEQILKINMEDPSIGQTKDFLKETNEFKFDEKKIPIDSTAIDEANRKLDSLKTNFNTLNGMKATVAVTTSTTKENKGDDVVGLIGNAVNGFVNRGAHASGGKVSGGNTLVGEQGQELVVDPHSKSWYTVGDNGSEMIDLPKDAIVYTASQTKELLSSGKTGRGKSTGKSFASGNAYVSGGGGKFIEPTTNDNSKTSEKAKKNSKDVTKETDAQKNNIEWIENAVKRIKAQVDAMSDKANDESLLLKDRLEAATLLPELLNKNQEVLSELFKRRSEDFTEAYNKIKTVLGEAAAQDYLNKVQYGRMSANDWREYFAGTDNGKGETNKNDPYTLVSDLQKKYDELQNVDNQLKENSKKYVENLLKGTELRKASAEEILGDENASYDKRIEAGREIVSYDLQEQDIINSNITEISKRKDAIVAALNAQMDPQKVQEFINQLRTGALEISNIQAMVGHGLSQEEADNFVRFMDEDYKESTLRQSLKKTKDSIANDIKKTYETEVNKIKAEIDSVGDFIKELNDKIDLDEVIGKMTVEGDYLNLIAASERQVEAYNDQLDVLEEELDELEDAGLEGSQAWLDVKKQINETESSIREATKQQAEWNDTMMHLPIKRVEKYLALLENINKDISNYTDLETSLGKAKTVAQIQDVIKVAQEKIKAYKEDIDNYQKILKKYEFGSDKFTETADAIQECEDNLSDMVEEIQNANTELMNLPIDQLNKINDKASKLKDSLDKLLNDYSTVLSGVDSYYEKTMSNQDKIYDDQVKKLQKQLDILNKQNDARKAELEIEKAKFNLDKARTQLTKQVNGLPESNYIG